MRIDGRLNAAINLYLRMEGLPPGPKPFEELMRAPRLVSPRGYVGPPRTWNPRTLIGSI